MAPQNEREDLLSAWRALASQQQDNGWRTIPIFSFGGVRVLAGRHFPDNGEAILVSFPSIRLPADADLPQAYGFSTGRVDAIIDEKQGSWVGLARQDAGDIDLFVIMVLDILNLLRENAKTAERDLFRAFINRILAWQSFMKKGKDRVLGNDEEIGLFGELTVLDALMSDEVLFSEAIERWNGPLGGIHDFSFRTWALEVKSTLSDGKGFPAHIGSLEQLDNRNLEQLFLIAVRLQLDPLGTTLPELAIRVREKAASLNVDVDAYDTRLITVGLIEGDHDKYTRKFEHLSTRFFKVADGFPRLVRGNVCSEIRTLQYQLDLDMIQQDGDSLDGLFGLIKEK
ncbi:MAG: PD-(D/E)XK motif protein [Alphaproteobacteria bacterium]|nr:PD-(D/E)XK motif protein [Alphaproteobacteria bacterium]